MASFVASNCVFLRLQLRKIMPVYALLQRMEIFGAERENPENFAAQGAIERYFLRELQLAKARWSDSRLGLA